MFGTDQNELLKKSVTLSSAARPIRIAYFVEDNNHANLVLDKIFAESYGRWGGIDTLIVPFYRGKMRVGYWEWLCNFDPDCIYSYLELSDQLIRKIHYKLIPEQFITHRYANDRPIEEQSLSPTFDFQALSSLSLIPFYSIRGTLFRERIEAVIDAYPSWNDCGFLTDNFGFASRSTFHRGFPLDETIMDYVGVLLLKPEDVRANQWAFPNNANITEIHSASEFLTEISNNGAITSVAQLSNASINGPFSQYNRQSARINIVIGDTFNDRVLFWNSRLLRQSHESDLHFVGLRIPPQKLEDNIFIGSLLEFLEKRHNFAGYNDGQKKIGIRSISIKTKMLKRYSDLLRGQTFRIVNQDKVTSLDRIVPEKNKFPEYVSHNILFQEQESSQRTVQFNPPYPTHLSEISNIPPSLKSGFWYADAKLSRHNNLSFFININHWWKLPRRKELVNLFLRPPLTSSGMHGRIDKNGLLSIPCKEFFELTKIFIPEDEVVFRKLFTDENASFFIDARNQIIPNNSYFHTRFSEEGQYLNGALGLFRSLYLAWQIINNRFWRHLILDLCDPRKVIKDSSVFNIKQKIQKKLNPTNAQSVKIETEEDWDKITNSLVYTAFQLRIPQTHISYNNLIKRYESDSKDFFQDHPKSLNKDESIDSVISERFTHKSRELQDLCERGIFSQGIVHLCKFCGHRNWFIVDEVTQHMHCQICKSFFRIPLDHGWDFMINQFLASCFREHGTMPLLWALGYINDTSRDTFLYSAPLELYKKKPNNSKGRDAELDIICIVDGKFIIGEVKRSASDYKNAVLVDLAKTVKQLRPDKVVLACFEYAPRKMRQHTNALSKMIPRTIDCVVEPLYPDRSFEEPSLP